MSKKALVIDNDFFFVEFIKEILEKRGYEVHSAYDGKEGITKLEERAVDILFCDMIMPKIDGEQVIQFARRQYPDEQLPIIAISGTIIEQLDKIKEIGATCFLVKGPLEKMTDQINRIVDGIEQKDLTLALREELFDQSNLFPRAATAELIDKVNYYKAIIESVGLGIIVVDRDARIITTNALALDILGKRLEEVLNRPIISLYDNSERPKVVAALKKTLRNQTVSQSAFTATMDSKSFRTSVSLFKIDDKIAGFILALEG